MSTRDSFALGRFITKSIDVINYLSREAWFSSGTRKRHIMNHWRLQTTPAHHRLPQPPAPPVSLGSFIACPIVLMQGLSDPQHFWQFMVYQVAFERAQAVVRPSLPERDLLAVWN